MNDLHTYSEENLLAQIENSHYELGFYRVRFYTKNGLPADQPTDTLDEFYLYPSGGTLRDKNFNIIFYSSKFDTYRGFIPPHLKS
ncbi:MAG: hypothetical protein IT279_07650 [Ignavibacteriaceae bacterium]|nr:hypothetical protein [Ignavibacteriaceae bacterium]